MGTKLKFPEGVTQHIDGEGNMIQVTKDTVIEVVGDVGHYLAKGFSLVEEAAEAVIEKVEETLGIGDGTTEGSGGGDTTEGSGGGDTTEGSGGQDSGTGGEAPADSISGSGGDDTNAGSNAPADSIPGANEGGPTE